MKFILIFSLHKTAFLYNQVMNLVQKLEILDQLQILDQFFLVNHFRNRTSQKIECLSQTQKRNDVFILPYHLQVIVQFSLYLLITSIVT